MKQTTLTRTQSRFIEAVADCMRAWRDGDLFLAGRAYEEARDAYTGMSGNGTIASRARAVMLGLSTICNASRGTR